MRKGEKIGEKGGQGGQKEGKKKGRRRKEVRKDGGCGGREGGNSCAKKEEETRKEAKKEETRKALPAPLSFGSCVRATPHASYPRLLVPFLAVFSSIVVTLAAFRDMSGMGYELI